MPAVYISHSSKDRAVSDAACAVLEQRGLSCWIAPRDIPAGVGWGEAILGAIASCRVMVIVFSRHTNESHHVHREVERAISEGLKIVLLRTEAIVPTKAMEYFLSAAHAIDASTPPLQQHLVVLADRISALIDAAHPNQSVIPKETKQRDYDRKEAITITEKENVFRASAYQASREVPPREIERVGESVAYRYDVFISAKSADYAHARFADEFLRKSGLRVFFSERELQAMGNSEYFDAIDTALEGSRHMLVVTTSAANVMSKWVKKEWQTYLNEKLSDRKSRNLVTLRCGDLRISDLPLSLRQHEARRSDDLPSLLSYFKNGE